MPRTAARRLRGVVLALIAAGVGAGPVRAGESEDAGQVPRVPASPWTWQADVAGTLLSRSSKADTGLRFGRAQAIGGSVDRRWRRVHLFVRGEGNAWSDQRDDASHDFVLAFNFGFGVRLDHGVGRLRSSLAAGASLLAVPSDVDDAGSVGAFIDVRPLGFVWPLGRGTQIGVFPLSLTLALPVLSGIPLVAIQYRTTVFAERAF